MLEGLTDRLGNGLDAAVFIGAPDEVVVARIAGRRICPTCGRSYHVDFAPPDRPGACDVDGTALEHRADDESEAVRARLRVYGDRTEPLLGFYRARGILVEVDGSFEADGVEKQIKVGLGPYAR